MHYQSRKIKNIPKGWRDVLPVHPAADLFPLMGKDELRELADDIAKHGLREKVDLYFDRDGKCFLLDGRNRVDALVLLGKGSFRRQQVQAISSRATAQVYSKQIAIAYVISKNIHRRHLTAEQKRDLIGKLLKAKPETANLQIAKQVGATTRPLPRFAPNWRQLRKFRS